jgi:peptide/nickel transport system ATP-binding protein
MPALSLSRLRISRRLAGPKGASQTVVEDLSLELEEGQTLALVGESGCGKTMTALAVMALLPQGFSISGGSLRLGGREISGLSPREARKYRGSHMTMIFQEPMTSLNPVMPVGRQVAEALIAARGLSQREAREKVVGLMARVGIDEAACAYQSYPHQFSGGMRQRIMCLMAIATQPRLVIADEPTSALDATVQGQILDLLSESQSESGAALLLITHDISAAAAIASRVAVLYAGRCLEIGPTREVLDCPLHPYTRGLLASMPNLAIGRGWENPGRLSEIPGQVPPLGERPPGCLFAPRCPWADSSCRREDFRGDSGPSPYGAYDGQSDNPSHWGECPKAAYL